METISHPVEYWSPALHRDALEHSQHGQDDVVEGGDSVVGSLPLLQADRLVGPDDNEAVNGRKDGAQC